MPKPSRWEERVIGVAAPADDRTVRRFFDDKPIRPSSRRRIEAAIVDMGLSHLLGAEVTDRDAAKDLAQ